MSLTKIPEPSSHFPQSKSGKADGVYKINSPRFPIAGKKEEVCRPTPHLSPLLGAKDPRIIFSE